MNLHAQAAQKILDTMRRQFGTQHEYRQVDAAQFPHLSLKFYSQCESRLRNMNFQKILDIEDVTVRSNSPDPRTFLRLMSNPESKISAAIYHVKPKFPYPLWMVLMGLPSKVYEFQSRFSDDAVLETSVTSPMISNSYPAKVKKQFFPGKSIEELYGIHKKTSDDYLSSHAGVHLVPTDSFGAFLDHSGTTFEMTKRHLEEIGWVTKEYLCKQAGGNKRLADSVHAEIQKILSAERPVNQAK